MRDQVLTAAFVLLCAAAAGAAAEDWRDDIDLPFVDDPAVQGAWQSVDFVAEPEQFTPGKQRFQGELYLKELVFLEQGKTTQGWWTWTKGVLMHSGDRTAAKYLIKDIGGTDYMFLEWKSGDYVIRHQKPRYYVLKREGRLTRDDIRRPFVDDPRVLGRWQSVDFVKDPGHFEPGRRAWRGELYLKELSFEPGGKTGHEWQTWTKGYVLHHGDRTASAYEIKKLGGEQYLFLEWKSGDVVFRGLKPSYYVLIKVK